MSLNEPTSTQDVVYFTRRTLGAHGRVIAWVYRKDCPKCKKAQMGKPKDEKSGKAKVRAKEYTCPACKYTVGKYEFEETLTIEAKYTCPHCKKQGESSGPFNRKKMKVFDDEKQKKISITMVRLPCQHCKGNIDITQKMK